VQRLKVLQRTTAAQCASTHSKGDGQLKAVIFDMGGVLVQGPGRVFAGIYMLQ